jgi:hypothetical protein
MANVYLHRYREVEKDSTALNAPHKYRLALRKGVDTELVLKAWRKGKAKVIKDLIDRVKERIGNNTNFAYAVAPSRTKIFVDELESAFVKAFPNAINITDCFKKVNQFDAGSTNRVLADEELRNFFVVDSECMTERVGLEASHFLLIDDVFSTGNTLRGLELLIRDTYNIIQVLKIAILKTT